VVGNVSSVLAAANAALGGRGAHSVRVPSEAMPPGSKFAVTLTVTNFLGYADSKTVHLAKLGVPAPTISVLGPDPVATTRSGGLQLVAAASLPKLGCLVGAATGSLADAKMDFSWGEATGEFAGPLAGTSVNPRTLKVAPGTLEAGRSYTFTVLGRMASQPELNNSASVTVTCVPQSVEARISGGAYRQVGRDLAFHLDGGGSYDPDNELGSDLACRWACAAVSEGANCSGLASASAFTDTTLQVPAASLTVGHYLFSLLVTKGSRNDSAFATVEVTAGAPPVIEMASLAKAKYNPDAGSFVSLSASVSSALPGVATLWTAMGSDEARPFQANGAATASVANKPTATVRVSALTPGMTYTFSLTATDTDGASSYSTLSLTVNEAPNSGTVAVAPSQGFALDTSFTLTALNWVDEDLPLLYRFGTLPVHSDGSLDTSMGSPFGDARSSATYAGAMLSAGANSTNFTVGCFGEVIDSFGAAGFGAATVRVRSKPLSVGALRNISEAKAAAALERWDADAAKQVLAATLNAMDTTTDDSGGGGGGAGRRRLLAAGGESSGLLESVLANLLATWEITPVTQANVASLLSNLVGIVDEPAICTDQIAQGSLGFLDSVLRASHKSHIGISSTAASFVASAFSYILETPMFNTSDPKSLSQAANVTTTLALASANQLYGAFDGVGYSLAGAKVNMYSYRAEAGALLSASSGAVALPASGDPSAATAAVQFNASLAALGASAGALVASSDLLDVRVTTLEDNLYEYVLTATAGTAAAAASRADQPAGGSGASGGGGLLLRSKLTVVEVAPQDAVQPLAVSGLGAGGVRVTLAATHKFNTSFDAFERAFKCKADGEIPPAEWMNGC